MDESQAQQERWRHRALDKISATLALLAALWLTAFGWSSPYLLATLAALAPLWIAAVRRLPFSLRAHLIATALLFISAFSASTAGPSPGALLAGLMAIICAGLFFGVRSAVLYWFASTIGLALGLYALRNGIISDTYDPKWNDARIDQVASRYVFTYCALSSCLALSVAFVVQRLSSALERAETALRLAEQANTQARAAAEAKESALLRMVEAQKSEVLAQLSASVAHDFNNCLQVIMANASVLQRAVALDPELAECASEILETCGESSQMARQLLTLGERLVLERSCLDLGAEIKSMERAVRRLLPSNIEVSCSTEGEHFAYVDRVQLKQALLNLAINAQHAMPDGGELAITVASDDENRIVVEVRDTGVGIDEETRARMFEPFYSTKGTGGSGLGLATVRAIVHQHEGSIEVESRPGQGSVFRLCFPQAEEPSFGVTETTLSTVSLGERVILVVDDDPRVRRIMIGMLRAVGARPLDAGNVEGAISVIQQQGHRLDLLCTDAIMPGRPVRDLIQYVREHVPRAGVLVCSAYVENELLRRGIETQQVAFLPKPFSTERFLEKVGAALKQPQREKRTG